jgi:hypothetical protein
VPASFDGSNPFFKIGNAARELSHSSIAAVRCAGSGRGASRRSGVTALRVRRPVIQVQLPGSPFHPRRIRKERRQVILPEDQKTAGEIRGVCHDAEYTPRSRAEKRLAGLARVFDEALPPKRCIVAAGDDPHGETTSA